MPQRSKPPICSSCVHLVDFDLSTSGICKAYPYGIPQDIFIGDADHRELRGDETFNLIFELSPEDGAAEMLAAFEAVQALATGGQ